ncbi:hypothetical protein J6590_107921, partial [Homalodisca vitripennis]
MVESSSLSKDSTSATFLGINPGRTTIQPNFMCVEVSDNGRCKRRVLTVCRYGHQWDVLCGDLEDAERTQALSISVRLNSR